MLPPKKERPDSVHDEDYDWFECETIEVVGANNTDDVLRKDVKLKELFNAEQ